ncbi:hypothetical protein ACFLX1_00345 [Chloroflexota bacterium]
MPNVFLKLVMYLTNLNYCENWLLTSNSLDCYVCTEYCPAKAISLGNAKQECNKEEQEWNIMDMLATSFTLI